MDRHGFCQNTKTTTRIAITVLQSALWLLFLMLFFASDAHAYWQIQWTETSTNESGFRVERKIKNQNYKEIGQTGANVTLYNDLSSIAGTQYCYRIVVYNQFGATTGPQTCAKQPR